MRICINFKKGREKIHGLFYLKKSKKVYIYLAINVDTGIRFNSLYFMQLYMLIIIFYIDIQNEYTI